MDKPAFHSILDLGLRDVGVRNEPRRLAAHFGRRSLPLLAMAVLFAFMVCAVLRQAGADLWVVTAFALVWTAGVVWLVFRTVTRAPVTVVKVTADGANQATWHLVVPFVLTALLAGLTMDGLLVAPALLMLVVAVVAWRNRGLMPALLRQLRPFLAADESVLGDGIGMVRGTRGGRQALRLVVATDRRLLVATSTRSTELLVLLDVPYAELSRFGIEWKRGGRIGELSLTAAGESHAITSIAPGNLLSIGRALQSHGVPADDPAVVADAEQAWEAALARGTERTRLFDPATMRTREFDRGLWLLLGLAAVLFYLNPLGIGLGAARNPTPALLAVPVLCAVCGAVARTRASLAYVLPLNLLVLPAFFFLDAGDVVWLMVILSALATVGLTVGSALRGTTAGSPAGGAAPGTLRHALGGVGLIRISGILLAGVMALTGTAAAAGFELTSVRLAVEEATAERLPVDGRSDLTGGHASLTYTPGPGLRELVTDEPPLAGPDDGARWELRSSFTAGYNVLTLGHYIVEPRLDDAAAVEAFIADKDRAHSRLAGAPVTHRERVVDGRRGYVWNHGSPGGTWYYAAWFPQPVHSVRVECIAGSQERRFRRLCAEAMGSLSFR